MGTTYQRLSATTEARFVGVVGHIDRMSRIAELIASQLGLGKCRAKAIRGAARLHDFGKLAIPDEILLKPDRLTLSERLIIEQHPLIGYELLRESGSPLLDMAASIALAHHERWDGLGYPNGTSGDVIPLEARIAAVADVFDSLTRRRPYRAALKTKQALTFVSSGRGTRFDPDVVDAFIAVEPAVRELRRSRGR